MIPPVPFEDLTAASLAELDRLKDVERHNALAVHFSEGASPGQRKFHEDPSPNRLLRAANKTGKTYALSAEIWALLTHTHPHREMRRKGKILYVCADLENSYADDVCASLRELEPPNVLSPGTTYDPVRGYMVRGRRGLLCATGERIMFRSGEQDGKSMEGVWADACFINEPPKLTRWGGITRACAERKAPITMGFTAVGQDLTWLRKIVEQDDLTKDMWSQTVLTLTPEAVPWKDAESVELQYAQCPKWERAQRIYAEWEGDAEGRAFEGFNSECISDDLPDVDVTIGLGMDHGELAGHQVAILAATWTDPKLGPCGYIFDEYVSRGATHPDVDALRMSEMVKRRGLSLFAITNAVGDVNTSGKSGAGMSVNRALELGFASIAKSGNQPPFSIRKARKPKGSILLGVKVLDAAFASGRLKVHSRCTLTIRSFRQWRGTKVGADKKHEHLIDASRYLLTDPLDVTTGQTKGRIAVG